jgi:hypothetical protein
MVKDVLDTIGVSDLSDTKISSLMNMDLPENVDLLTTIGEAAAKKYVDVSHLPDVFNMKGKFD